MLGRRAAKRSRSPTSTPPTGAAAEGKPRRAPRRDRARAWSTVQANSAPGPGIGLVRHRPRGRAAAPQAAHRPGAAAEALGPGL
eukprot:7461285-Heterocapsa_arctica.AAC.1